MFTVFLVELRLLEVRATNKPRRLAGSLLPPSGGPSSCNIPADRSGLEKEQSLYFMDRRRERSLYPQYLCPEDILSALVCGFPTRRCVCCNTLFRGSRLLVNHVVANWVTVPQTDQDAADGSAFGPHCGGLRLLRSAAVPQDSRRQSRDVNRGRAQVGRTCTCGANKAPPSSASVRNPRGHWRTPASVRRQSDAQRRNYAAERRRGRKMINLSKANLCWA